MAESKTSISSKGGANVLAKRVQKQFNRAQEKVLQKFGKSAETKDEQFEQFVINLHEQQNDAYRIYKDLKAYLNAVRVMRDASSRLFQSLYDAYDPEWDGAEDLGAVVEGEDLLWNDYESKLRDQALLTMDSYMSQFPDVRERVAKRNRKLVDYDSARNHLTGLQNAKKKDDIKIGKAEDEMKAAKTIFEDINRELKEELPILFDSRIGCYITVFQAISDLRDNFYNEMTKNNQDLQTVMKELKVQHPDQRFTVKNFNRSGSLKRRSLRETLSPRSLKSFYDFHMSYSPRGSLRRDNTHSFRSERSTYESYSPKQTSPTSPISPTSPARPTGPQPRYENIPGAKGAESSSINLDYPTEEGISTTELHVDDTKTSEDKPVEEEKKAEKKEASIASDQDGNENSLPKDDSSSEAESEEHDLQPKSNPQESSKDKPTAHPGGSEEPTASSEKVEEPGPTSMENGITPDSQTNVKQNEASSKAVDKGDQSSGEVKEEEKTEATPK